VAAAAVVLDLHHFTTVSGPANTESIPAYITMVNRGYARQDQARNATAGYCLTLDSVCPAPRRPLLTALQRWLGDLSRIAPPARFVVIDAQLRRHLVANISDLNAMVAAHQARDQNGFDRAYAAALNQRYWIDAVVLSIDISRPATAAAYIDSVRSMKQTLDACVPCPFLGSTSQVDCPSVGTSNCQNDVTAATSMIAALEAGLVRTGPPDSLSAQATQLQEDMAQADTALLAMAKAELTNDQTGFNSARLSLQQAWPAIDADIAAILTS
jgi:hypothetical protein